MKPFEGSAYLLSTNDQWFGTGLQPFIGWFVGANNYHANRGADLGHRGGQYVSEPLKLLWVYCMTFEPTLTVRKTCGVIFCLQLDEPAFGVAFGNHGLFNHG